MLYERQLRDHLPCSGEVYKQRKEWIMLKEDRGKALAHSGRVVEKIQSRFKRFTNWRYCSNPEPKGE